MDNSSLKYQLLVAMPQMADPNFDHTVSYIVEHGDQGAMGLTINRPVQISLMDILVDMDIAIEVPPSERHQVVAGGPIQQEAGFVLHPSDTVWHTSVPLGDGLCLTTSRDILEAIAVGEGPDRSLVCLGYAGWEAGQLEQELADNAWLSTPASKELVLHTPFGQRWETAAARLGIDMSLIATQAGHS